MTLFDECSRTSLRGHEVFGRSNPGKAYPIKKLAIKLPAVHNFSSAQQSDPMPQSPLLLPDSTILAMHLATLFDLLCCDSRLLADGDETDKQYVTTGSYPISSSNKLPARLS